MAVFILIIGVMLARKIYFYDPESEVMYSNGNKKIGGWLVIPAIGIAFTPFLILVTLFNTGFFHSDVLSVFLKYLHIAFSLNFQDDS